MSWMPAEDPVLGDKQSSDALDLMIVRRVRDLADGFTVGRALLHARRQMVGPFIFFDQMGPVQLIAGQGLEFARRKIPSTLTSGSIRCGIMHSQRSARRLLVWRQPTSLRYSGPYC
jgi:hypothetical protein